ncbi:MAG: Uma2 family endonuclease [Deltaproteobacteria bacterium]|nr:Uma2 family endonuclease [Deltaproteobacteria bacterium]
MIATRAKMDEATYLEQERRSDTKHEFINGEILAMSGASARHNVIAANILSSLSVLLRSRPCIVYGPDQRIHIPSTGAYCYPDVSVACGRQQMHTRDADSLTNPVLLVEVLSDSTEAYDRGAKFADYRNIPSLEEYLLVSQLEERIEHFHRLPTGQWILTVAQGKEAVLELPALSAALALHEVYAKLDLLPDPAQ